MQKILAKALNQIDCHDEGYRLIGEILKGLSSALDASSSTFWEYDKKTGLLSLQLSCISDGGDLTLYKDNLDVPFPTSFPIKKYRTTRQLYFEEKPFVQVIDIKDEDLRDHGQWLQSLGVKAVLQLPVVFENDFVGWIPVHSSISKNPWNNRDIQLASELANELAIGLRIKELADQVQEASVFRERAYIAGEIHDTMAQDFFGILVQLDLAELYSGKDEKLLKTHLSRIRKLAEQGLKEARRSIHNFKSDDRMSENLVSMIRSNIETNFEDASIYFEEIGQFPEIVNDAKYEIYRIINEALSNAIRHSNADEIKVVFSSERGLTIQIKDNGIGISPCKTSQPQNYGIEIMHERARKIGIEIDIYKNLDSGTTVDLSISPGLVVSR